MSISETPDNTYYGEKEIENEFGDICATHKGSRTFGGWWCELEVDFDWCAIKAHGDTTVGVDIKYCPFCGKRLVDE